MSRMIAALLALTIGGSSTLAAQGRVSVELRAGAAVPTADLGDVDLATGFGFEGTVAYRFIEHLALYGGWDWHRFTPSDEPAGSELDVEETGYAFGLRFQHPLGGASGPQVQLRAGGTYNHIEIEEGSEITADSDHGLGWEAGVGLLFGLGDRWLLGPGIRYRSLTRELTADGVTGDVDLRYLTLELAVSRTF